MAMANGTVVEDDEEKRIEKRNVASLFEKRIIHKRRRAPMLFMAVLYFSAYNCIVKLKCTSCEFPNVFFFFFSTVSANRGGIFGSVCEMIVLYLFHFPLRLLQFTMQGAPVRLYFIISRVM